MTNSHFEYSPGFRRNLRVLPSRFGGMGVFCDTPLEAGALIELSAVNLLIEHQIATYEAKRQIPHRINLRHYVFGMGRCYAIPRGFGSFYNHAPSETGPLDRNHVVSNATFAADEDLKLIAFSAKYDIPAKHEILIDFFRGYALNYEQAVEAFHRTYGGISREDGTMTPMPRYRWSAEQQARAYPYESADKFRDLELEEIVSQVESIEMPSLLERLQKMFKTLGKNQKTIAI